MADNDTLRSSIAELIGKKPGELKPEGGANIVRSWQEYLTGQGYTVTRYLHNERITGRHILLYAAADGALRAVLSDSPEAAGVKAVSRLTVTKTPKAASSKDA